MKHKRPIAGWMVVDGDGTPMLAQKDSTERFETLWRGNTVTLFPSRRRAQRAIKRTIQYAEQHGWSWPWVLKAQVFIVRRAAI